MNTFRIRTLFVTLALLAFSLGGLLMGCGGSASAPPVPKDTVAPTLAISGTTATATKDPVTLTFIFSEDVGTTFTASDVTVTNGTAAAAVTKVDSTHYTLVVTPAAGSAGTMTATVAAGAFTDVAGNPSAAAATATQAYDTQAPTLAITGTSASAVRSPLTLTFTFSEDVGTSFAASDVTVTNGTAAASVTKVDGTHYTLVVTPATNSLGTMGISVAAGSFSDVVGNVSTTGATASQAFDTTAPTVAITGTNATATKSPVTLTFTFSKDVGTSFTASDVAVTNGTAAASVTRVDATHYTLVVTPATNTTGTMQISVAAGVFADLLGNSNTAGATASQTFDTQVPTVAITGTNGTAVTAAFTLTFTFSEDIGTSFTASDVVLTNATAAASVTRTDATHYTLVVTPAADTSGTIAINVAAGAFSDLAGNASTAAATASQTFNTVLPTYTIIDFNTAGLTYTATPFEGGLAEVTNVGVPTGGPAGFVAKFTKPVGAQPWAGATYSVGYLQSVGRMPFSATANLVRAVVYSPTIGATFRMKVEDANDATHTVETDAATTAIGWQTLTFHFANQATGTAAINYGFTYNKISLFPAFLATADGGVYYIGPLTFVGASAASAPPLSAPALTAPTTVPAAPSLASSGVISLYNSSHTYSDVSVSEWNPNWGQGGSISDVVVAGATIKKLDLVNYQGVAISAGGGAVGAAGVLDVTGKGVLHVSYWTSNGTKFNFSPINAVAEVAIDSGTLVQGAWTDLELAIPAGFDLTTIRQLKFDTTAAEVIYLDNLYFHSGVAPITAPTTAPTAPSLASSAVISLYNSSHTYTDVSVSEWNPNWGQGGSISDVVVGSATLKKLDLVNYQGVAISTGGGAVGTSGVLNVTGKGVLHLSYWTANGTKFNFYPINAVAEVAIDSGTLTKGAWTDLELTIPAGFDLTTIRQLKFDTTSAEVIFLDNIYFHGASGTDTTPPTVAISGTSSTATKDPVTLTFTFSEDVGTSFTASDVVVTNGTAAASVTRTDATHYTLVITPNAGSTGTMGISIAAGAFSDLAGNASIVGATASQDFDTQAPTVAITGTGVTPVTGAVTLTFTFSEDIGTSFIASDVTVTNGTAASTVTKVDATHYTLVVTPNASATGTMVISVAAGAFSDVAGNPNTAGASVSQDFSTGSPSYTIIDFNTAGLTYIATAFGANTTAVLTSTGVPTGAPTGQVVQITKGTGADTWAGTTLSVGHLLSVGQLPFSATANQVTARVYSPTIGCIFRLKAEDANNNTHTVETDAVSTSVGWQTLTFSFANQATGTAALNLAFVFNKVSIFPAFGSVGTGAVYYVGPLTFLGASAPAAPPLVAPASSAPTTVPAAPSLAASAVISLYTSSHTYTDAPVSEWNPNWGQAGSITDVVVAGATIKKLDLQNYQGVAISTGGGAVGTSGVLNVTGKTTVHLSYWTSNGTKFNFYPINATGEVAIDSGTLVQGAWTDLELTVPAGFDVTTLRQLKFDTTAAEVIYLDNIYFHAGGGGAVTAPTTGASAPSVAAGSVISLYTSSNTYTNAPVGNWNPGWGQGGSLSDYVAGSATVKKLDLVLGNGAYYQGVHISSDGSAAGTGVLNITGKNRLHISYWTANGTKFNFFPINAAVEVAIDSGTLTKGAWTELDFTIPAGFDLTTIRQLKFDATGAEVIYLDNIYFH